MDARIEAFLRYIKYEKNYSELTVKNYLPRDTRSSAEAFLDVVNPACAVFMVSDFGTKLHRPAPPPPHPQLFAE